MAGRAAPGRRAAWLGLGLLALGAAPAGAQAPPGGGAPPPLQTEPGDIWGDVKSWGTNPRRRAQAGAAEAPRPDPGRAAGAASPGRPRAAPCPPGTGPAACRPVRTPRPSGDP